MGNGWISLHRQIMDWEWFSDVNTCHLFIYCLLKANHKPANWRGIDVDRGELITSISSLSKETGLSEQQARTAIKKLKKTGDVTSKTTNKYTVISITNYDKYQDINKQDNKQITSNQQTNNKQITTNNKNNNKNNDNKDNNNRLAEIAFENYNLMAEGTKLPLAQVFSDQRKSRMKERLKECGGLDGWNAALGKVKNSPFLMGEKTDFVANLDFMLQKSSFIKIMEGAYDDRANKQRTVADQGRELLDEIGQGKTC